MTAGSSSNRMNWANGMMCSPPTTTTAGLVLCGRALCDQEMEGQNLLDKNSASGVRADTAEGTI